MIRRWVSRVFMKGVARHFRMVSVMAVLVFTVTVANGAGDATGFADSTVTGLEPYQAPEFNMAASLIKVVLALALTITLMLLVLWMVRRLMAFRGSTGMGGGAITVLEMRYIAPKKAIALVRVANRVLVVGITDQSMNTLGELLDSEVEGLNAADPPPDAFASIFERFRSRKDDSG